MAPSTRTVRVRQAPDHTTDAIRRLLTATRGGANRVRILRALGERPRNANRLAVALDLDYKTVRHHLGVLEEAGAVTRGGDRYGAVYVPTARARRCWDVVDDAVGA